MRPLQVWLPWLGYSVGHPVVARDIRRAHDAWDREHIVFLLPGLRSPERWQQKAPAADVSAAIVAVPSEYRDAADVIHVGENGYVFAPFGPNVLHRKPIGPLLDEWLALDLDACRLVSAVPVEVQFPVVRGGQIAREGSRTLYEVRQLELTPGGGFPMTAVLHDDHSGSFELRWPPEDWAPTPVHPDAEAAERAVRTAHEAFGVPGAMDVETGTWNPHLLVHWSSPFDVLFRAASGFDSLYALGQMRAVVQQAASDPAGALAAARAHSSPFLAEGDASLAMAALGPRAVELHRPNEPMTVRPFWESYGIIAKSAPKAFASPEAQHRVPVTRTWGGIGLLWALLIARLEEARPLQVCERCGKMLTGRKKVCDRADDPACYAARRAEDQRRSRKLRGRKPRRLPSSPR